MNNLVIDKVSKQDIPVLHELILGLATYEKRPQDMTKLYPLSRTFLFICSRERLFVYFTTYNPL